MGFYKIITSWDEVPVIMDLPMAARLIGVTPESLKKRCQRGTFPAYKEGALWRVDKDRLREYIDSRTVVQFADIKGASSEAVGTRGIFHEKAT